MYVCVSFAYPEQTNINYSNFLVVIKVGFIMGKKGEEEQKV